MNLPEIKQYRFDVSGTAKENLIPRELIPASDERNAKIVVPRHAPFFIESVHVYRAGHTIPLTLGEHYDFVSIDHDLSEYCGNRVSWVIRKLKNDLPDLEVTYQTLGTIPALTETTKYWYEAAALDQRPVWFDQLLNKPKHFIPMLHGHDLAQGFFNFQRLIEVYENRYETLFGDEALIPYREWFLGQLNNLKTYVEPFRLLLERYTDNHINHDQDPHGTRSRDIPGLDQIDEVQTATNEEANLGLSERLRTVSAQATNRIIQQGPDHDAYIPNIFLNEDGYKTASVIDNAKISPVTEITVGVKDLLVNVYVDRSGVGRGEITLSGVKGNKVLSFTNPNPVEQSRNPENNIWYCDQQPTGYDIMIAGGNSEARVFYKDRWYLVIDDAELTEYNQLPSQRLAISGDMSDVLANHREYRLIHTDSAVHLIRTIDHASKPTVIWKTIKYDKVSGTANPVTEYTFSYNTINDNTVYNEKGRVIMFHRGFSAGKYSNGDLVFSDPVNLVERDNQILVLPTVFKGKLYFEFLVPETFSYKGEERNYVHSHMAEATMNHASKTVSLTWTETRARPYIVTERLFSANPEANNYFEQVAVPFPFELTSRRASLVSMSQEGFFGFGFKADGEGEMFVVRLTPGDYTLNERGRLWHLADTGEWLVTRAGGCIPKVYSRLDVGHVSPMNPYMGVWAESNERNRYGLVKGIHSVHGMGFFYKNLYGGVNKVQVDDTDVYTSLPLDNIDFVHHLTPDHWIGTSLDVEEQESEFVWSVGGSDSPSRLIPNRVGFGGGSFNPLSYVEVTDEFLTAMNVNLDGHWTLVLGGRYGLPDILYNTYVEAGKLKTKVQVFRLNSSVLTRVDGIKSRTPTTRLTAADKVTVSGERVTTHDTPKYLNLTKVDLPEPTLDTNVINVLISDSGRTTILLCPNNRYGDDSYSLTFPTVLNFNQSDDAIMLFDEDRFEGCIGLSPDLGWVRTNFSEQTKFGGLVNAGTQLNSGYQARPSYVPNYNGPVGMFNMMPENEHQVYFPVPLLVLEGSVLHRLDATAYNTKHLISPGNTASYNLNLVNGLTGPCFEVDSHHALDDGWFIDVTDAGVKLN